jgi:ElaB/YqjD/DUF883 family membrane-anchored ribosome-binding protein
MSEENTSRTGDTSAAESMRMSYSHARDAARQAYDQVRGQTTDYLQQGKAKMSDYQQQIEEQVREKPMRSVLIAAGAGLLVGMLLRRL